MARIHCYEAFTASELHRLLEQISALHTVNNRTTTDQEPSLSSYSASLIVINGLANLISPSDWDYHHHYRGSSSSSSTTACSTRSSKVSDMLNAMASVRKLMSLSILILRTAQTSDEWTSGGGGDTGNNATGAVLVWDSCVDLRVHLQQTPPLPPSSLSSSNVKNYHYQCDIVKARVPVADTRAFLTEL
ncbi:hypothetical protein BDB00DRAFT_867118 [Zychaea mexicana]|uniref:uncharacterized protein n=1 Tax=Zychaea mexicana TaxID=64656 RepID=UPI0022FE3D6E|nr:uncharacterized protein BDB00DRAFT_867118 [Zychaea mexicana]KAI9499044.1 hypothetical protein BDB00DRAFT_867118 [Zychaea mexicana]